MMVPFSQIPVHPMLVHFPVALFLTSFLLECISLILKKASLHDTAVKMYVIAALFTPITAYTGLWEAGRLHLEHPVLSLHRKFALITMYVSFISLFLVAAIRSLPAKTSRTIFFILALSMCVTVSVTGYYGGKMVYEYGVGSNG